jgi:hypothetical protein
MKMISKLKWHALAVIAVIIIVSVGDERIS